MSHACHRFWKCYKTLTFCSLLTRCTIPGTCHAKRHLNVQKWRKHVVFLTFWLRNVLHAPTACTFRHLNFQKWSEPGVLCTFWLRNVLRATTACTFSTSQLPKVVRAWCALYILTWKCASRHIGVHFFIISTSKSVPKLRCFVHFDLDMCFAPQRRAVFHLSSGQLAPHPRFSEPTFRPSGATNHWKNTVFRDFPAFSRTCILSSDSFSSLIFSLLLFFSLCFCSTSSFHLSILSEVWLLNFLRLFTILYPHVCDGGV